MIENPRGEGDVFLFEFDDGDADAAELDVFVFEAADVGDGGEVVADELAEDTCTCAVQDSYGGDVGENGVVDEVGDGLYGFVAAHAADVYFMFEMELFFVEGVGGLGADKGVLL